MNESLFLVDVRRKVSAQDIFRSKTVIGLLAEIDKLQAERDALKSENDKSILQLMDEVEMRLGIHEDRWGALRGILEGAK